MSLSETVLRKLTKDEIIALTLEYQAKFDNTLFNINKELGKHRNEFKKIESELSVSKNLNVARTSNCIREKMLRE